MAGRRRYPHRERMSGKGRMRQFMAYVNKTQKLATLAQNTIKDFRRNPQYEGFICFLLILVMLLKRYRSFNAFEQVLQDPPMKKLFRGFKLPQCTQTIKDTCRKMDLKSLETLHHAILSKSAKNKVFDKTRMYGMRLFAFDGVEPISSRKLSCQGCLSRTFQTQEGEVTENYHRFVFLQSIGPPPHLILGFEPQANVIQRKAKDAEATKAEGELTAVKPLVARLRKLFPRMFRLGVGDALYANGPMFAFMRHGDFPMDLIAVLKKETDEPMADAITIFQNMKPALYYDKNRGEHVRLWDSEGFEALSTCPYPLRVIKAETYEGPKNLNPQKIDWDGDQVHTWWMGTGLSKDSLTGAQAFDVLRHRWDEENFAFMDLTKHWHFKHAYFHHEVGIQVMMYAFMMAYNLFQLFLHRCLRNFSSSRLSATTIVGQMIRDFPTISDPQDGFFPFDTS
jgi:hypothetical protein